MPRVMLAPWAGRGLVAAVAVAALGVALWARAAAQTTFNVWAGAESEDAIVQVYDFIPSPVTINVGDTVTWTVPSTEFHTVTFLLGAPTPLFVTVGPMGPMIEPVAALPMGGPTFDGTAPAGSGLLEKGGSYSLTFTAAGSFDYVCIVHPGMVGRVIVREAGQPADTPAAVESQIAAHVNTDLARRALPVVLANTQISAEGAAATVVAGAGDVHTAVYAFLGGDPTVHVGDTVMWINRDPITPHTVSFLAGGEAPEFVQVVPQEAGPPLLLLAPQVLGPVGDAASYDGTTYLNSGFIGDPSEFPTPVFTARFTRPGRFEYVCLLHPWSMRGIVTVVP